jgi:hypothetical protein
LLPTAREQQDRGESACDGYTRPHRAYYRTRM